MATLRYHFAALLKKVSPSESRRDLARDLPAEVRDWLHEHDFETKSPHTRLSGSYARSTAILDINDVDVLLFLPPDQLERTPNAVLQQVKRVLDGYPDAFAETTAQRRSVHLEFPTYDLHLDIVPAVAPGGTDEAIKVPDRPAAEWIASDPLGYGRRLSAVNQAHGGRLVRLIKVVKAWRDVQMKIRRPKSYVLEVMALYAVENEDIVLVGKPIAQNVADFFSHVTIKYHDLMEMGVEAPRIRDPQIPTNFITRGWERSHFETFMRRAREADKAADRALCAKDDESAAAEWKKVFGDLWPTSDEVKSEARTEAATVRPGLTKVTSTGGVVGYGASATIPTQPTKYHGLPDEREA